MEHAGAKEVRQLWFIEWFLPGLLVVTGLLPVRVYLAVRVWEQTISSSLFVDLPVVVRR